MEQLIKIIAEELKISTKQVSNTLKLLEDGNTVPFIARYRKEVTNNLDEEQILFINNKFEYLKNLEKRKEDILRIIETQGKLTDEIIEDVHNATKLSTLEDIYRPYKLKKKTRASIAINNGLEPFSQYLLKFPKEYLAKAKEFINDEVKNVDEVIQGASDIIAEMVSDNPKNRQKIKDSILNYGVIETKVKKNKTEDNFKYKMYYDFSKKIKYISSHNLMAIDRAVNEKVISCDINYDKDYLIEYITKGLIRYHESPCNEIIKNAVLDGLKRLAFPSVEREIWSELLAKAASSSIEVFSYNVEKLIMQAPLKNKVILGVDPAFRTGCKLAVISDTGKLLDIKTIYQNEPHKKVKEAEEIVLALIKKYPIEVIAIGNGTASRETESFFANLINKYNLKVLYTIVSEAGASVYSASELARNEFPNLHVEQRSAISIARRLLDPLAELIKIDPQSIGVGQYQHDLPKKELQERLDFAISKCVNRVGADLNTSSYELLVHISGLNKTTAKNIVDYRNEIGRFKNRKQLKNVKKLGPKAIEQCAGFLRINDGDEMLDKTSIHPESYQLAYQILHILGDLEVGSVELKDKVEQINITELAQKLNSDKFTVKDILDDLVKPTRDYRDQYEGPMLRKDVLTIDDLHVKDKLQGVVRNVVDFGAFVDIGLKEDGLIHISKMSKNRIKHPSEVLEVGDIVDVYVYNIDELTKKVQLSLVEW